MGSLSRVPTVPFTGVWAYKAPRRLEGRRADLNPTALPGFDTLTLMIFRVTGLNVLAFVARQGKSISRTVLI